MNSSNPIPTPCLPLEFSAALDKELCLGRQFTIESNDAAFLWLLNLASFGFGFLDGNYQAYEMCREKLVSLAKKVFPADSACLESTLQAIERSVKFRKHRSTQVPHSTEAPIETYSGVFFNVFKPDHRLIFIADIAHALSNLCMFQGHTGWFYSMAQHAVLVSRSCPDHLRLEGLLNLASLAYLGALPDWLQHFTAISGFNEIIEQVDGAVRQAYGLATPCHPDVKAAELLLLATERRDLLCFVQPDWQVQQKNGYPVLPEKIVPLDSIDAEQLFLDEYDAIQEERATQEIKPVEG